LTNEIFWDTDVNPEGLWAEYKAPNLGNFEPFIGAGGGLRECHGLFHRHMTLTAIFIRIRAPAVC